MIHNISKYILYGLFTLGAVTIIKRSICGETKTSDYTTIDAVFACALLFLMYLSW